MKGQEDAARPASISRRPRPTGRIFVSYRRDDTAGDAGRLSDALREHFGEDAVFLDILTIAPGEDFAEVIRVAIGSCDVLIALIGKAWLTAVDAAGHRRLDDPHDFVRLEIQAALEGNTRVLPTLVQGATMPLVGQLPEQLAPLASRNAFEISYNRWPYDVDRLIEAIEKFRRQRAAASPHNLPRQLTSFVGREREVRSIKETLLTGRLVTLTGPGGIGKTRLGLQAASELLEDFPDGVWLVELAPVTGPDLVPQAIASALGITEQPGRALSDTLEGYLGSRRLLLVLDNCEHLIDATARLVERLLHSCPEVQVLATSREALDIGGEAVRRVPSLSLPDSAGLAPVQTLASYEAVALFCDRAAAAVGDFSLTEDTGPFVVQICRRLDGIPLAIELAAVGLRVLSLEQIAVRLNDRFHLLRGGNRTALRRQQTLRATIDWSYDLLADSERAMLRRLAVFAGGIKLEAAEEVCAGTTIADTDVLDLITQLVAKSLVQAEDSPQEARFRLLETIREYGLSKLREAGEAEWVRKRHSDWFIALAERAEQELRGKDQTAWFSRLEVALDNLRAALDWCSSTGDAEGYLRLAGAMGTFWRTYGYLSEGRAWLERGLTESKVPLSIRAKAIVWAALLALDQGDGPRAVELSRAGLDAYRGLHDQWGTAFALQTLGRTAVFEDDYPRATSWIEESVSLFREAGDKTGMAVSLYLLGLGAWAMGDYPRATTLGKDSLRLSREVGDTRNVARALEILGRIEISQGNLESAGRFLDEALTLFRPLRERRAVAVTLYIAATLARYRKDFEAARALADESLSVARDIGDKLLTGVVLCELGILASLRGEPAAARTVLQESLEMLLQTTERLFLARAIVALATVAHQQAQSQRAAVLFAAAEALTEEIGGTIEPLERDRHDRAVKSLRAELGEAAWSQAEEKGRTMTRDQLLAYTLEDTGVIVHS